MVQERGFSVQEQTSQNFSAHEAITRDSRRLAGAVDGLAGAREDHARRAGVDGSGQSPFITLFSRESQQASTARFQTSLAEQSAAGGLMVALMAFGLEARLNQARIPDCHRGSGLRDSGNPFVGQECGPSRQGLNGRTPTMGEASVTAEVFRRIVVEPAYKAVSAQIARAILDGALPLGAALPTEQQLSERFGVHRSTVREAIRQVEQEGLLQRREGRRLFVCLPGVHDLAPRATRLLLLQQTTFQELWELAMSLEPLAARLAAQRAEAQDLQQLQQHLLASDPGADHDDAALVRLDVEFHALVGRASHNRALMLAREPVGLLYNPTLRQVFGHLPQARARNQTAHQHVVEALLRRDADAAAEWTARHMVDFQRGFAMAGLDMAAPIVMPT
jgi:DNA-binding FadR family transcriptional regulator